MFLPLTLTQGVVQKWVREGRSQGKKVVFTSSMGGLFTPANWGTYVSTKHALESIAEALQQELAAYGVKIQTINPGAYYTGYNETMADNPFRWLDDSVNFTKRADLRKGFDDFFATPEGKMDPKEMIDRMIEIVPADDGQVPQRHAQGDRGHAEGPSAGRLGKPDLTSLPRERWRFPLHRSAPRIGRIPWADPEAFTKDGAMNIPKLKPNVRDMLVGMLSFLVTGVALLLGAEGAEARVRTGDNREIVRRAFDAWSTGTGSPYDLLTPWMRAGRSPAIRSPRRPIRPRTPSCAR